MDSARERSTSPSQRHIGEASVNRQSCTLVPVDPEAEARSQAIDRALEEDAKARTNQVNVFPTGNYDMKEIAQQLKDNHEIGLPENERISYRYSVHQRVVGCTKALVDLVKSSGIQLGDDANDRYQYLCDYMVDDAPLDEEAGRAIEILWKDPSVAVAFQSSADFDSKNATYFFSEISKIAAPDYVPTEVDILKSRNGSRGVVEHRFLVNGLSIRLIDVGTQSSLRQKWMHKFYNVDAVLFVVDLLSYDIKISNDDVMTEQIWGFEGTISSRWCADTVIILFFNEVSAFRRKLSQKPLGDYLPDYTGSNEDQACEYLLQRFKAVNHGKRKLYSYFVDPHVTSNIELIAAAIKDSRR